MELSTTSVNVMASANSPDEAAKIFLGAVSQGLAAVIAEQLGKAVNNASASSANASAIQGWEKLIGGCAIALEWATPRVINPAPLTRVLAFAPYETQSITPFGVSVGVGINVTASF
jgi:hypothetical protein